MSQMLVLQSLSAIGNLMYDVQNVSISSAKAKPSSRQAAQEASLLQSASQTMAHMCRCADALRSKL